MIRAFWYTSSNFGDALTPWLVARLSGRWPVYTDLSSTSTKLVASGSILNLADKNCVVLGAGLANVTDVVDPGAHIVSVRGPLSRARAIECGAECPAVYGDLGFLLPRFLAPSIRPQRRVALVPHYVDQDRVFFNYPNVEDIQLVDILGSVESVVDGITAAPLVVSSSLHGLVVALAYGIPCVWARFSDRVIGDGMKFRDLFASVGIEAAEHDYSAQLPSAYDLCGLAGVVAQPNTAELYRAASTTLGTWES